MPSDHLYELGETARSAMHDFLMRIGPGDGRYRMDAAYSDLTRFLAKRERAVVDEVEVEERELRQENKRKKDAWRKVPHHERIQIILGLVGDDHLLPGEITDRFVETHREHTVLHRWGTKESWGPPCSFDPLIRRLWKERELDREAEAIKPGGTAVRYRYFRRGVEGEVADLERRFHQD